MTRLSRHRSLATWTLLASLLLGLLACGLQHGQAAGLSLSGLQGGFCSVHGEPGAGIARGVTGDTASAWPGCPLCSSFGPMPAAYPAVAIGLAPPVQVAPIAIPVVHPDPPRQRRPALNPRASPA